MNTQTTGMNFRAFANGTNENLSQPLA